MASRPVIVDYDCISPLGSDFETTWIRLADNQSGIGPIDRYRIDTEPLQGVSNVAYGGQIPLSYDELAGSAARFRKWNEPGYHAVERLMERLMTRLQFDISRHDPQRIASISGSALCSQVSRDALVRTGTPDSKFILNQCQNIPLAAAASLYGIQGPCFNIGSACASSAHALLLASQFIEADIVDCAVVFGHEFPLLPSSVAGLDWVNALYRRDNDGDRGYADAAQASRPMSRDRRGFVLSEGAGVVFMAGQDYARKHSWPVRAIVRGGYCNSDADHVTRISSTNTALCMRNAMKNAGVNVDEIECVNAHATSTPLGDRSELTALGEVFGAYLARLPVVANKSQLGHSLGAAAILETAIAVESMAQGILPPTLNHEPDPELPPAFISPRALEYPHKLTLANSFGFGGTNVSLVLERATA
ncbi:MAG: beta-ketoacyl-[acyl-carrier-protein] synthase family protein [Acidobacteriota bacterium]